MKKLKWEGPRNRHTDYSVALVDSKGDTIGVGDEGSFTDEDTEALSVTQLLTSKSGKEVEPETEPPADNVLG